MIALTAKAHGLSFEQVKAMSYVNMVMYGKVLPHYGDKKEEKKREEVVNADDPKNRDKVRQILSGQ